MLIPDVAFRTAPRNPKERDNPRSARRCHLVRHLYAAGLRAVLEALMDVAGGRDLDETLEDFGRVPAHLYREVGADRLPTDELALVEGGWK